MSNEKEKVFADGFIFKQNPNAPEWVIGSLSLKADEAIKFIQQHTDKGWVNLNIKVSQGGKPYVELDTWKPDGQKASSSSNGDDLPF